MTNVSNDMSHFLPILHNHVDCAVVWPVTYVYSQVSIYCLVFFLPLISFLFTGCPSGCGVCNADPDNEGGVKCKSCKDKFRLSGDMTCEGEHTRIMMDN